MTDHTDLNDATYRGMAEGIKENEYIALMICVTCKTNDEDTPRVKMTICPALRDHIPYTPEIKEACKKIADAAEAMIEAMNNAMILNQIKEDIDDS